MPDIVITAPETLVTVEAPSQTVVTVEAVAPADPILVDSPFFKAPASATFRTGVAYAGGQLVVYENVLYQAITSLAPQDSFDPENWRIVNEGDEAPVTIVISPDELAGGVVGAAYSQTLSAENGTTPYEWLVTAGAEPTGLDLDPVTGELAGTPTVDDTFTFTVTVVDANDRQRSQPYSVTIAAVAAPPAADSDDFNDDDLDLATWDPDGAVVETGGVLVTPEGTSATTVADYDLTTDWPAVQLIEPNSHATGRSTAELTADGGDLVMRVTNDNGLAGYRSLVLSHSPLLYWPLDEESGTAAADEAGSGRDGVYTGNYTLSALQLAAGDPAETMVGASTSYVLSTYNPIVAGTKRTFFGWAKRDSTANRALFGAGGTALRAEQSTNQLRFTNNSYTNSVGWDCGAGVLTAAYFWALVYDDATKIGELYVNGGTSLGTKTLTVLFGAGGNFAAGAVFIGSWLQSWIGGMGHVVIVGDALTAEQIQALYDAGSDAGLGGGGLHVEVIDTGVTVLDEQYAAAAVGEYVRFGCASDALVFHRSAAGSDPWTTITSSPLADELRVAVSTLTLGSSNPAGNDGGRNAKWDNYSWLAAPTAAPPPDEPITALEEHFVWSSSTAVGEDASRGYVRHHRLNGYGVDRWGIGFQHPAGYGGYGNWLTAAGGGHVSGVNQQQERGEFSRLDDADRVGKPCVNGIYLRPGVGAIPGLGSGADWSTFSTRMGNWATWCTDTGAAGLSVDLEGAVWDYLTMHATEAAARAIAYDAGAEFGTAVFAGFPDVDLYIYGHDFFRTWRWWAKVWFNGNRTPSFVADRLARDVTIDFFAGMFSVAPTTALAIFLQSWAYKSPQAGQSATPAGWQFAAHSDIWGLNPNGTNLDRFGVAHPGLLGMDWIFKNRFNDGGFATANRLCVWSFLWAGNTSTDESTGAASTADHVIVQATELARFQLTLPYPRLGMAWFDYGRLSYAEPDAPHGGYPAINGMFAL